MVSSMLSPRLTQVSIIPVATLVLLLAPSMLSGQALGEAAVECFRQGVLRGDGSCDDPPSVGIFTLTTSSGDYPEADVRAALDGLKRLALEGSTQMLRVSATIKLHRIAIDNRAPKFRTFDRIEQVYRQTSDRAIRSTIVSSLHLHKNKGPALRLLEEIASARDGGPEFPETPNAYLAILGLAKMGEEGRAVLRRLHETDAVVNLSAKGFLEGIAKNGYRYPQRRH